MSSKSLPLRPREVAAALRACAKEHDWREPPPGLAARVRSRDLTPVVHHAGLHGVATLAYLSLRGISGVDVEPLAGLEAEYLAALANHVRTLRDLGLVAGALEKAGVPWLVFKGPILSEAVYGRPDLRHYSDLDVAVPRDAFADALAALEHCGGTLLGHDWALLEAEGNSQLQISVGLGTVVDLHWHLLNRSAVRRSLSIPMKDLFASSRMVSLGGIEVRTLGDCDTLLHLCIHAALSGGVRLLWLKDIERSLARTSYDWDAVVHLAACRRARALIGVVLERARLALDAPVPVDVVARLVPSRMRRTADHAVSRAWLQHMTPSDSTAWAWWVKFKRDEIPAAASVLAARVRSRARARRAGGRRNVRKAAARRHPSAHGDRSRYLRYVESVRDDT